MVTDSAKTLEEILNDAGLATPRDLERARRRMAQRGGRLLGNLVAVASVDDVRLALVLGEWLGLPALEPGRLEHVAAPRTPSRRASLGALAVEHVLLPVGVSGEPPGVDLAMFDPTDTEALARVRTLLGTVAIRVFVAPYRPLLDAIGHVYGRQAAGELGARPELTPVGEATPRPTRPRAFADDAPTPAPMLLPAREARAARAYLDVVALLADLLEERVARRPGVGRELARTSRLVARELGCAPAVLDEIGVAARLHAIDRLLHEDAGADPPLDLAGALGRPSSVDGGVPATLHALAPLAAGVQPRWRAERAGDDEVPLGARVIAAVAEYLALAMAIPDGQPDRATVSQLLRVTTAPEIIEALCRVLDAERGKEPTDAG